MEKLHPFILSLDRKKGIDIGLTTEVSAVVVYALGYLVYEDATRGALLGVLMLALLYSKTWLHRFVRQVLKPKEVEAMVMLLVLIFGVIPFLPNRVIDPWGFFNPQRFAWLIVLLAALQFASYTTIRLLGGRVGLLMAGFLGGVVSSTAVFSTLPYLVKENKKFLHAGAAAAILAVVATLLELLVILLGTSPVLFKNMLFVNLTMIMGGGFLAFFSMGRGIYHSHITQKLPNPLNIKTVLKLSLLMSFFLLLAAMTKKFIGSEATTALSFVAGLFELHGITLAIALIYEAHQLSQVDALQNLGIAILGSFCSKFILLKITGASVLYRRVSGMLLFILLLGVLSGVLQYYL